MSRIASLLLVLAVVVACDSTSPAPSHVGTYELHWVNGQPLPRRYLSAVETILGARFVLNADGTFCDSLAFETSTGVPYSVTGSGIYTRDGDDIIVNYVGGTRPDTLFFAPDDLTLTEVITESMVFLWRRSPEATSCGSAG